jgi:hypothetical protein
LWDGAGLEWMLMGGNGTQNRVPADTFKAQWRDENVHRELVALGFELPEQMGALFMGDAPYLADITANVPPVTDNYPLRISSELVRDPGRVPLYATVMDERERLERFARSDFIARLWPEDLAAQTPPYFRYEGLIKEHFTQGLYPAADSAFLWESLDDVLANSRLETLALWLLGTDRDAQRNALLLGPQNAARPDVALELTLARLAQRDYSGALQTFEGSMSAAGGKVSIGSLSLLLYLLGKNGKTDDARALIATLDTKNTPAIGGFVDWFDTKFDAQAALPLATTPR